MTGHPLDAAIIQAIDNVIKQEIAEADEVRHRARKWKGAASPLLSWMNQ
jgi:hypothetical protein